MYNKERVIEENHESLFSTKRHQEVELRAIPYF